MERRMDYEHENDMDLLWQRILRTVAVAGTAVALAIGGMLLLI
jgi:hypothetical protein